METRYITAKEAAEVAHVTPKTIRAWIRDGRLRGKRYGVKWLTTREWLEAVASTNAVVVEPSQAELEKRAAAAMQRIHDKFGR